MIGLVASALAADASCWPQGRGLDAAMSPFAYRQAPAVVSDALLYTSLIGAVAVPVALDTRDSLGGTLSLSRSVSGLGATGLTLGSTFLTKSLVCRPRPYTYDPANTHHEDDDRASFFSGHTASAAVGSFSVATFAWLESGRDPLVAGIAFGSAGVWTATMGGLRVAAGKHYLSDVLVGGAVGAAAGVGIPLIAAELVRPATTVQTAPVVLSVGGSW
jgi:membrane-associated phospholipid phosphatase